MRNPLLALALFPFLAHAEDPTVRTRSGTVVGARSGDTLVFKGIPFAAAPVGALRFAPPVPHEAWPEPLEAKRYGAKCLQIPLTSRNRAPEGREDCLFLNVWKAAAPSEAALPVLVFVHGGGNVIGSGYDSLFGVELYNGEWLASHGPAVVVTFNYRLGPLGFLAHPALSSERGGSGNYGLLDQILALRWVRENIAAFGGDARNVTVFGESAGAIDILGLLASPLAAGLFDRAVVQSGFLTEQPLAAAEEAGTKLATALGCDSAACLRGKTGAEILAAADQSGGGRLNAASLTIDGTAIPGAVLDSFRAGRASRVPVIIGSNADEMSTLGATAAGTDKIDTEEKYVARVREAFGAGADAVLAEYPVAAYQGNARRTIETLLGDLAVHCPARRISRALSASGQPVWKYLFRHVADNSFVAPYGAAHAFELPYVFHNLNPLGTTAREAALSEKIARYWLNFAAAGDPNGAGQSPWPRALQDETLSLDFAFVAEGAFHAAKCDFWDRIPPGPGR